MRVADARRVRDLVLLHGWGSSAGIWDDLARCLAPRFRIHAMSLPGYGTAAADAKRNLLSTVAAIARDAPRRCHVIGWSLGGTVALAWARRAPRQVRRLAVIAATPCFIARSGWPCGTAPAVLLEFGRSLAGDRPGMFARFVAAQAKGDSRAQRVASALQQCSAGTAPDDVLAAGLELLRDTDLRGEVRRIRQPVLVLHGAHDRIVPPAAGRRLAAALPHAQFALLRACAHAPFVSQPERIAKALREFFDE